MTQPYQLAPPQLQKYFDNAGRPLAGGLVYTYAAGTSTPQASYPAPFSGTPNPNPVTLNARGEAAIWLDPALSYKINVTDAQGNQIPQYPQDNVPGGTNITQAGLGLIFYPRTAVEQTAGITPTNFYIPSHLACGFVLIERYGGAGDNSTLNDTALSNASLVAGQIDARIGLTCGNKVVYKFANGISLTGTGQALGGNGTPVGGVGATGARLIGVGGVAVLSFSGLSTSTDCITVGGSSMPQVELRSLMIQCNGSSGSPQGRDGIVNNGSNLAIYENVTVISSQRHAFSRILSGSNFVEKMTMRQCRAFFCGQHALFDSLSGSSGAYINECLYDQLEVRGVSKITAGGNAHRMTSTATLSGSTFSNHYFAKTNFDCQYATGAPLPDLNVVNADSGKVQSFTYACGAWENTGNGGSPGSGVPVAVTGSATWSGIHMAGMITNSLWGANPLNIASFTQATVFDESFALSSLMGPATIIAQGSSLGSKPALAIQGQTTSLQQPDISVTRTGAANSAINQGPGAFFFNSTSSTAIQMQEFNGAYIFYSFASGAWNERGRITPAGGYQINQKATLFAGSGAPAFTATQGDLYIRTDTPATANQRLYMNTSGSNTWTAVV